MPDIHAGYGFSIRNVAAFNCEDPDAVVCPGGIGYDINCGVRCLVTSLSYDDIKPKLEELADKLYEMIPPGGNASFQDTSLKLNFDVLGDIARRGIDWAIEKGYALSEDRMFCEDHGRLEGAKNELVSQMAKQRGLSSIGTIGSGNHYLEIQKVEQIFDQQAAEVMGFTKK